MFVPTASIAAETYKRAIKEYLMLGCKVVELTVFRGKRV